ncbi:MAG: NINE protein [Acutalibacteraceae bacterium]
MFCRNCGAPLDNMAAVCIKCGVPVGQGNQFCNNCGAPSAPNAAVCTQCGVAFSVPVPQGQQKSKMAAGLLGIFLGALGVHNFYLGYTAKAVIQLVITIATCGIGGIVSEIWGLIEGIMILTGSIAVDGKGVPLGD